MEEGDALEKGKLSAFQWEVRWESHLADRDGIGLGLNKTEGLIQYLRKIGPNLSKDVRRDKRFRRDGKGGNVFWGVETWEEAHEVVKGIEETNAGQRALNNSTFTHGPAENKDRPKKEKKPDKVLVQGPEASDAGKLKLACLT